LIERLLLTGLVNLRRMRMAEEERAWFVDLRWRSFPNY
jgi:hypothetical protein